MIGIILAVAAVAAGMNQLPWLMQQLTPPANVVANPPLAGSPVQAQEQIGTRKLVDDTPQQSPITQVGIVPSPSAAQPPRQEIVDWSGPPVSAEQPLNVKRIGRIPDRPKPRPVRAPEVTRDDAEEDFDSETAQRLMANIDSLILLRSDELAENNELIDVLWKRIVNRSKSVLEKAGIEPRAGKPNPKSPVLVINLVSEPAETGAEGSMIWTITAELICAEASENSSERRYVKVWKGEERLGTLTEKAAEARKIPGTFDQNISDFFGTLRGARNRAVRAVKKANDSASDSATNDT